jgi:DNA-binding LytR/AlgR family response regulator
MQPFFFIRDNKQYVRVNYNELIDNGAYLAQLTVKQLEKLLPADSFCRINRGCIVSINRILTFDADTVTLKNKRFQFTERYLKELEQRVNIIISERRVKQKGPKARFETLEL